MSELKPKLDELQQLPQILNQMLKTTEQHLWKVTPSNGGFNLIEQICHLRDLEEEGYLVRIHRILNEHCPELADFDGAKIARERNYSQQDAVEALRKFETSRRSSIAALSQLQPEQLTRNARFAGSEMITMNDLVQMMLEHDRSHKAELEELRKELNAG
jgi:DinB superfamily